MMLFPMHQRRGNSVAKNPVIAVRPKTHVYSQAENSRVKKRYVSATSEHFCGQFSGSSASIMSNSNAMQDQFGIGWLLRSSRWKVSLSFSHKFPSTQHYQTTTRQIAISAHLYPRLKINFWFVKKLNVFCIFISYRFGTLRVSDLNHLFTV